MASVSIDRLVASPSWASALPTGPATPAKLTEAYVRLVIRDAFFWAWPLVNMTARRIAYEQITERFYSGAAPMAPLNELTMLTDYFPPDVRLVACPNQDVVYGGGLLALDKSPAIIQVPDFGTRFWVYQVVNARTDGFAQLGKMYGTTPGFYMLAGPDWQGDTPRGVTRIFRSDTRGGNVIPRVFLDDSPEDRQAIQEPLRSVMMYPLDQYDGTMKTTDWSKLKRVETQATGDTETPWVVPDKFADLLPRALAEIPPLPGEEARYAEVRAVLDAIAANPGLRSAADDEAAKADTELVEPLFQFRNFGLQLPHLWSTTDNTAKFGTDYFTRTAVAKSNIFVNSPTETKYFYQDFDASGARLNGKNRYLVTFPKGATPPVNGFWSLTLYNENHFFAPNEIRRYSLGTKNKGLRLGPDGSLTIHVQSERPGEGDADNWLPAPDGADFSLYLRCYWPKAAVTNGDWTPPPVKRL